MASRVRASSLSSNTTASSSDAVKAKPTRPRLSSPNKRVSFDAVSVPLPSATWEELATPSTLFNPSFALPSSSSSEDRLRALRKAEIDSNVDLKAVLAQGIVEWRNEVEVEVEETA